MAGILQEDYRPLSITVPDFEDPKVTVWAKNLEYQLNRVLIKILQANQDRLMAGLFSGSGNLVTGEASVGSLAIGDGLWTITQDGDKLYFKYGSTVANRMEGV